MAAILPLLVALLVLHNEVPGLESAQCSTDNASKFRVSVSSRRNATGHRLVRVRVMDDEAYDAILDAGSELTVDFEQDPNWCSNSGVNSEATPMKFQRPDYEFFTGLGYYKIHTKARNWEQARLTCVKEGAHLLIVNSEGEAGVVKQILSRISYVEGATWPNNHMFVGFSDLAVEGQYITVLGQSLSTSGYAKWAPGEPVNIPHCLDPDTDCGLMRVDGLLFMRGCSCTLPFICEKEL